MGLTSPKMHQNVQKLMLINLSDLYLINQTLLKEYQYPDFFILYSSYLLQLNAIKAGKCIFPTTVKEMEEYAKP